ncbi:MAG: hypothetical protein GY854_14600 [Deltaproteobacteria bacterium]|nr:hypothetical protein [Deltaproteobacteria bacterium]
MTETITNEAIIARYKEEPAPFMAVLHAFMERDGFISSGALEAIGKVVGKSSGALGVLLGYYKKFPMEATEPVADLQPLAPLVIPAPGPADVEESVFESIRLPQNKTLDGYRRSGGYEAIEKYLAQGTGSDLVEVVRGSGLRGRGGGGYSTGEKWRQCAKAAGDSKVIVCNGDEGDPKSFKDRVLLELDPHSVIEGMLLAAFATGASLGFVYLRGDYTDAQNAMETALEEARRASLLGDNIRGSDFGFSIYVRKGAGTYVCGEETVLLNTLEGNYPFPRTRPPYPVTRGFESRPTVVNNVETFAAVSKIAARGPKWYKALGRGERVGTRLVSLTGDVAKPGCYEIPAGTTLNELLFDWAGGARDGRSIEAVSMAGVSGGFLGADAFDVELDDASLAGKETLFGNGAIEAFDDSRDLIQIAAKQIRFFKKETCFKCEACVIGVEELAAAFDFEKENESFESWCLKIKSASDSMRRDGVCGFGGAAALCATSMVSHFKDLLKTRFDR